MQITTIGFDLAKNVFQLHGIDVKEKVVARKQLRRGQVARTAWALMVHGGTYRAPELAEAA
jgi:hypothetical protein